MNCNCKFKIKDEYKTILNSSLISQPVNLSIISEEQYPFYIGIFPYAFEKICTCSINKEDLSIYNKKKKK